MKKLPGENWKHFISRALPDGEETPLVENISLRKQLMLLKIWKWKRLFSLWVAYHWDRILIFLRRVP